MIFFNYYVIIIKNKKKERRYNNFFIILLYVYMKENYAKLLKEIIKQFEYKPNLLLHSCCAPCSSYVIEYLRDYFNITIIYYNPNISPKEEYEKRKAEQIRFIKNFNDVNFLDCDYDNNLYEDLIKGLEEEPERGKRCNVCFKLRLERTVQLAKNNNFDFFGTTLTVSPYKNATLINDIGRELESNYKVKWLYSDFKKDDGYKKSIELSKVFDLYRQNYCGCIYSKKAIDSKNLINHSM